MKSQRGVISGLGQIALLGSVVCPGHPYAAPVASPTQPPYFSEASAATGIAFQHFNGMSGEYYLVEIMGAGEEMIEYVTDRLGHDRRYAIDSGKAQRELGWRANRSDWPEGLERTVAWYRDNEAWWRRVKSGEYREYYERQYGGR